MAVGDMSIWQIVGYGICMLGIVVVTSLVRSRYFSSVSDIPGPMLGSVGTCFQLWEICGGRINEKLALLHRKYGVCISLYRCNVGVVAGGADDK